jgi:hypothetical protein
LLDRKAGGKGPPEKLEKGRSPQEKLEKGGQKEKPSSSKKRNEDER